MVPDGEFGDRWERVFREDKIPAPSREAVEPHNAGSEVFGGRERCMETPPVDMPTREELSRATDELDHALLLGDGWTEIKPRSDHLPGGAFTVDEEKTDE